MLDDPNFVADSSGYVVEFDFNTKQVRVYGDGVVTAVENIGETAISVIVDVYTMQGTLVREGVDKAQATAGLPAGIYIVGGKKILVK